MTSRRFGDVARTFRKVAILAMSISHALEQIDDIEERERLCNCPRCRAMRGVSAEGKES